MRYPAAPRSGLDRAGSRHRLAPREIFGTSSPRLQHLSDKVRVILKEPGPITYEDGTDSSLRADDGTGKSVTFSSTTLPLYSNKVECGSCHDPHGTPTPTKGSPVTKSNFMLRDNWHNQSTLCMKCHL